MVQHAFPVVLHLKILAPSSDLDKSEASRDHYCPILSNLLFSSYTMDSPWAAQRELSKPRVRRSRASCTSYVNLAITVSLRVQFHLSVGANDFCLHFLQVDLFQITECFVNHRTSCKSIVLTLKVTVRACDSRFCSPTLSTPFLLSPNLQLQGRLVAVSCFTERMETIRREFNKLPPASPPPTDRA